MASTKVEIRDYPDDLPTLIRLTALEAGGEVPAAGLVRKNGSSGWFQLNAKTFEVRSNDIESMLGDVILVNPKRRVGDRLLRQQSQHNTLLITERCDQYCIMCSQPPKDYELDLFDAYDRALGYAPQGSIIGISGGEPLLYKQRVCELILSAASRRSDIGFHVLTNAQHLRREDIPTLQILPHERLRFAVPIYAANAALHDEIVGKSGAFEAMLEGIAILMEAGAEVEIRTVLLQQNVAHLDDLASFLAWTMPDIDHWALMQLEYIGFAKKNWETIFYDHSRNAAPLVTAVEIAEQHGLTCKLYNTPLCTLPERLRSRAPRTISDWKQSYFPQCVSCNRRADCSGVFAWAKPEHSFSLMEPL